MQQQIQSVMLKALNNQGQKLKILPADLTVVLSLDKDGNIVSKVVENKTAAYWTVTLTELIGMLYAVAARLKLKKMLLNLETEMMVSRGGIEVLIWTTGVGDLSIAAKKNKGDVKHLNEEDIKKLM